MVRGSANAEAVEVLRKTLGLLKRHGWLPHYIAESERFAAIQAGNERAKRISLNTALQQAGDLTIEGHHARQLLQRIVGPVVPWEQHPLRVWREVEQLLLRGIELGGGEAPRRGGWRIGGAP